MSISTKFLYIHIYFNIVTTKYLKKFLNIIIIYFTTRLTFSNEIAGTCGCSATCFVNSLTVKKVFLHLSNTKQSLFSTCFTTAFPFRKDETNSPVLSRFLKSSKSDFFSIASCKFSWKRMFSSLVNTFVQNLHSNCFDEGFLQECSTNLSTSFIVNLQKLQTVFQIIFTSFKNFFRQACPIFVSQSFINLMQISNNNNNNNNY